MEDLKISDILSTIEGISIEGDEKILAFLTTDEIAQVLDVVLDKLESYKYFKVNKNSQCLDRVPPIIYSGHFGNGLTVWYANTEIKVAHIDVHRNITFYEKSLNYATVAEVLKIAETDDRYISASQTEKVFIERPKT